MTFFLCSTVREVLSATCNRSKFPGEGLMYIAHNFFLIAFYFLLLLADFLCLAKNDATTCSSAKSAVSGLEQRRLAAGVVFLVR